MGKISMRAVQQQVYNLGGSGDKNLAYVLRPDRYTTIGGPQIIDYCAENAMVPRTYVAATMQAVAQCVRNFLLNGHHIVVPNLGTFSLTSTGVATTNLDEAGLEQLKKLNVRFLPCKDLKQEVENVEVELEGIYVIAGETIIEPADGNQPAKVQKHYMRVNRTTVTADDEGNTSDRIHSVTLASADPTMGTVSGSGTYAEGTTVTIRAIANSGYRLKQWSDGVTQATRELTVDRPYSLTAQFEPINNGGPGSGGDEIS